MLLTYVYTMDFISLLPVPMNLFMIVACLYKDGEMILCIPSLPDSLKYHGSSLYELKLEIMISFLGEMIFAISDASIPPNERPISTNSSSCFIECENLFA